MIPHMKLFKISTKHYERFCYPPQHRGRIALFVFIYIVISIEGSGGLEGGRDGRNNWVKGGTEGERERGRGKQPGGVEGS